MHLRVFFTVKCKNEAGFHSPLKAVYYFNWGLLIIRVFTDLCFGELHNTSYSFFYGGWLFSFRLGQLLNAAFDWTRNSGVLWIGWSGTLKMAWYFEVDGVVLSRGLFYTFEEGVYFQEGGALFLKSVGVLWYFKKCVVICWWRWCGILKRVYYFEEGCLLFLLWCVKTALKPSHV